MFFMFKLYTFLQSGSPTWSESFRCRTFAHTEFFMWSIYSYRYAQMSCDAPKHFFFFLQSDLLVPPLVEHSSTLPGCNFQNNENKMSTLSSVLCIQAQESKVFSQAWTLSTSSSLQILMGNPAVVCGQVWFPGTAAFTLWTLPLDSSLE